MKRRMLAMILTACLLMPLAACGGAGESMSTTTGSASGESTEQSAITTPTATQETTVQTEAPKPLTSITFSLFSDFHYKAGMYMSTVADMEAILARAHDNEADFIIHVGDFCNDFRGSPELVKAYLENAHGLPAYGVYGNHELESTNNSMSYVTPRLTNQADAVVWGTEDGKIGDGSIGYYYYEVNGFRIICTDTNYSYNPTKGEWEHNLTASYGAPAGNEKVGSLGPQQLSWLERVLHDAADRDIPCIVFGHYSFSGIWSSSPDAPAVQKLYKAVNTKCPGTVMLSINGHLHTNRTVAVGGVVYMDVNTTRNGYWMRDGEAHYTTQTFPYKEYNQVGTEVVAMGRDRLLSELSQAKNTWFFAEPLSAVVTVDRDGTVTVEGQSTRWYDGIVPPKNGGAIGPQISSGTYQATGKAS